MTEIKARYFHYFRKSRFIPVVLKLKQSIFRTKLAYLHLSKKMDLRSLLVVGSGFWIFNFALSEKSPIYTKKRIHNEELAEKSQQNKRSFQAINITTVRVLFVV